MNAAHLGRRAFSAQMAAPAPIASLAMYDWPELQWANDAIWSAIAAELNARGLAEVPVRLTRNEDLAAVWTSPSLLLGQTCGYPLMTRLKDRVRLVATPCYDAPGCEGPFRRSAIVVAASSRASRLADLRGARCALNDATSDSGMNLLRAAIAPLAGGQAFFSQVIITASHLASAEAVASGAADAAALDAVSYAHLRRLKPEVTRALRLLQWTERTPGLPLVTAADPATVRLLQAALSAVAGDPELADARRALLLSEYHRLPLSHYRAALYLEERARVLGYEELR
ncbi:MAG: PhnD/SsuA/transferrin family substrate-binding protein [Caulobacteraceae bacterium]|nr:PhnD/SsuA/transferrin family substrate-binding protein [Caulobacteraceae bacterium]